MIPLLNMAELQNLLWLWAYTVVNGTPPTTSGLQVATAVDATAYSVVLNGNAYTYTSGTGSTTQEIVDGLVAAINATAPDVTATGVDAQNFTVTANSGKLISNLLVDPAPNLVVTSGQPADNVGFAFADDPKMAHDFVLLKVGGPTKIGGSDVVFTETDNVPNTGDQNLYLEGLRELQVEVKVFANTLEAVDWIAALQASFENPSLNFMFDTAGTTSTPPYSVVVGQPGDVLDLTGPLETQYEHVFYFDVILRVSFQTFMGGVTFPGPGVIEEIQNSGQVGSLDVNIDVVNPTPEP